MATTDKNKAIIEYLLTCEAIAGSTLYFNFANIKDSVRQFITLAQDVAIDTPYINGDIRKRYSLTIISYLSISANPIVKTPVSQLGTSQVSTSLSFTVSQQNENITDMAEVQALIDWISEQEVNHNYPNFGSDCEVELIRTTTNNPILDQIDATKTPPLAKYTFTIQVDYIDTSKRIWS